VSDDDVALIWLQKQSDTTAVRKYLNANVGKLFIEEVMAAKLELKLRFNDPATDSRTPDIIVQPVLYGTLHDSAQKIAEHGGFQLGRHQCGIAGLESESSGRVAVRPRWRRRRWRRPSEGAWHPTE